MIKITVDKESSIPTIQAALALILPENQEHTTIVLKSGVYEEPFTIILPFVTIEGEDKENTILQIKENPIHIQTANTTLKSLTIQNEKAETYALQVEADQFMMRNCHIVSINEVLHTGKVDQSKVFQPLTRQYYMDTTFEGSKNLFQGNGTCLFENCKIISLTEEGPVCVPSHVIDQEQGFIFKRCEFIGKELSPDSVTLVQSINYGIATFVECYFGKHIKMNPTGNNTIKEEPSPYFVDEGKQKAPRFITTDSHKALLYTKELIFNNWFMAD